MGATQLADSLLSRDVVLIIDTQIGATEPKSKEIGHALVGYRNVQMFRLLTSKPMMMLNQSSSTSGSYSRGRVQISPEVVAVVLLKLRLDKTLAENHSTNVFHILPSDCDEGFRNNFNL